MADRARVIALDNDNDVMETIGDLVAAVKEGPAMRFRDLAKFYGDFERLFSDLKKRAEKKERNGH